MSDSEIPEIHISQRTTTPAPPATPAADGSQQYAEWNPSTVDGIQAAHSNNRVKFIIFACVAFGFIIALVIGINTSIRNQHETDQEPSKASSLAPHQVLTSGPSDQSDAVATLLPQPLLTSGPSDHPSLQSDTPTLETVSPSRPLVSNAPQKSFTNNPSNSPSSVLAPDSFPIQWIISEWMDQNGQNRCIRYSGCAKDCGWCCKILGIDPFLSAGCQNGWIYHTQKKTIERQQYGTDCWGVSTQYGLVSMDCKSNIDSSQQWELTTKNQIMHVESGKCVEITGSDVQIYDDLFGTSIILSDCKDIINQRFRFVSEDPSNLPKGTMWPSNRPNTQLPSDTPSHSPNTELPSDNPSTEPSIATDIPVNVICLGYHPGPTQLTRGMPVLNEVALTSSYEIEFDFHINSWFDDKSWPGVVCRGILYIGPDDTTQGSDFDGGYPDIAICEAGSGGNNYWEVDVWDRYRSKQRVQIAFPENAGLSSVGTTHHVLVSVEPNSFSVTIDGETKEINKADANIPNDYKYPIWFGHPAGTPFDGIISNLCIRKKI